MKALKWVLIVVGAVCLGFGLFMVIRLSMDMGTVMNSANADRTGNPLADPMPTVWIVAGIALAAGVLLGLGLGLPRRTSGAVRRDALEGAAAQREQSIRENALRRAAVTPSAASAGDEAPERPEIGADGRQARPELEQGGRPASDRDENPDDGPGHDDQEQR